jgi:hypothetical protein
MDDITGGPGVPHDLGLGTPPIPLIVVFPVYIIPLIIIIIFPIDTFSIVSQ